MYNIWTQLFILIFLVGHPHGWDTNLNPIGTVIQFTNDERESHDIKPLRENYKLDNSALMKCQDMLKRNYWAHYAPDGTSPWTFFALANYKYEHAGENLAHDFPNDKETVDALMKSPPHKQNILNPDFTEIGVAKCTGKIDEQTLSITVQHFGKSIYEK